MVVNTTHSLATVIVMAPAITACVRTSLTATTCVAMASAVPATIVTDYTTNTATCTPVESAAAVLAPTAADIVAERSARAGDAAEDGGAPHSGKVRLGISSFHGSHRGSAGGGKSGVRRGGVSTTVHGTDQAAVRGAREWRREVALAAGSPVAVTTASAVTI